MAARTASSGELIRSVCNTTKNRRFLLPLIGDDQSVGAGRGRVPGEIKDVHHAFPDGPAFKRLADRNRLGERRAAVHTLDCDAQFIVVLAKIIPLIWLGHLLLSALPAHPNEQ